jgi:hypothetical protein
MPRPPWKSPRQEKPRAAGLDPNRVNRCADLLAQGATVEQRDGDVVWLHLGGRNVMHTTRRTLKAAQEMRQAELVEMPHG